MSCRLRVAYYPLLDMLPFFSQGEREPTKVEVRINAKGRGDAQLPSRKR